MPLLERMALLVLLLCAAALVDWLRARDRATRWREYSFLLIAGVLGGAFGAAIDQVSLSISPEYFMFGKGLEAGGSLRREVTGLGFHAGFLAGAIGAGVILISNNPQIDRPALSYSALFRVLAWPLVAAGVVALPGALWLGFGPAGESSQLIERMFMVRGLHTGLYLGWGAGLVWAGLSVRRGRRRRCIKGLYEPDREHRAREVSKQVNREGSSIAP